MTIFIHFIVGEFDFLKGDDLLPQLFSVEGGIGMDVEASWGWWVGLPSDKP